MKKILVLFFLISASLSMAQTFTIRRVELKEQKVVVHYDLQDSVSERSYTIHVYQSGDNYITPLQKVVGDAGLEVKPGNDRQITWDVKNELGENFSGRISLEIRGRLYVPFIRFKGFDEYGTIKRGKPYSITWSGGTPQNILNFDLLRGEEKVATFPNISNVGHYTLELPTDTRPGSDYRFRISDTKNKDEVVYTGNFSVKRKTPLLLKVLPVVAVGVGITLLSKPKQSNDIPDPIQPK